jgi:hypothetical protein
VGTSFALVRCSCCFSAVFSCGPSCSPHAPWLHAARSSAWRAWPPMRPHTRVTAVSVMPTFDGDWSCSAMGCVCRRVNFRCERAAVWSWQGCPLREMWLSHRADSTSFVAARPRCRSGSSWMRPTGWIDCMEKPFGSRRHGYVAHGSAWCVVCCGLRLLVRWRVFCDVDGGVWFQPSHIV